MPIISTVLGLLGGRKWLLIAAGVLAVVAVIGYLWLRLDAATADAALAEAHADTLEQALSESLEAVEQIQAGADRNEAALSTELAEAQDRARRFARIREEVSHATDTDTDACVGPAVRAAVDGLRR